MPGQDCDFACNVHASQIVPGVWLRIAGRLCLSHDLREAAAPHQAVEDVGQRPAENALNLRPKSLIIPSSLAMLESGFSLD